MNTLAIVMLSASLVVAAGYWWHRLDTYLDARATTATRTPRTAQRTVPIPVHDRAPVITLRPTPARPEVSSTPSRAA